MFKQCHTTKNKLWFLDLNKIEITKFKRKNYKTQFSSQSWEKISSPNYEKSSVSDLSHS